MAVIVSVGLFLVSIIAAALSRIVAGEIEAWTPAIIRGLVKLAVGRLPEEHRERFEEEWKSHIDEVPGVVGKILAAAGFLLAAHRMALTVRHSNEAEGWLQRVAQFEDSRSKLIMVVNTIRDDKGLASYRAPQVSRRRTQLVVEQV